MRKNSLLKKYFVYDVRKHFAVYRYIRFKFPNNFVTGGVAGIGVLLSNVTPITAGQLLQQVTKLSAEVSEKFRRTV